MKATGEANAPVAEPVPVALLAAAPTHIAPAAPLANLAHHGSRRNHAMSGRYRLPSYLPESAATPFSSTFDGAGSSAPPNPYYLPDPSPASPDGASSPVASGTALDAIAAETDPKAGDEAATAVAPEPARRQAELAPSASAPAPDVSAVEPPALPMPSQAPATP